MNSPTLDNLKGLAARAHVEGLVQDARLLDEAVIHHSVLLSLVEAAAIALEPFAKLADVVDDFNHEDESTCTHRIKARDLRDARKFIQTSRDAISKNDEQLSEWALSEMLRRRLTESRNAVASLSGLLQKAHPHIVAAAATRIAGARELHDKIDEMTARYSIRS